VFTHHPRLMTPGPEIDPTQGLPSAYQPRTRRRAPAWRGPDSGLQLPGRDPVEQLSSPAVGHPAPARSRALPILAGPPESRRATGNASRPEAAMTTPTGELLRTVQREQRKHRYRPEATGLPS